MTDRPSGQPTGRDVLEELRRTVVVAVLRAPSAAAAVAAVDALVAGGITGIEVTYSTPDVPTVLREVRDRHPDIVLGAGTVLTAAHAEEAVGAGAEFLVSPGTLPEVTRAMLGTGATVLSGALTPTEVMTAVDLGVHVVKLFPSSLGGPAYLKALRRPFPDVDFCPTGGVNPGNLGEWLAAGAVAVGAGGELTPATALASGDWAAVTAAAREFRAAADAVRGSSS